MSEDFDAEAFRRRAGVSRETLQRFETWRRRLAERNAVVNLVGKSTLPDFWVRHALDSWQIYELAPDKPRWLDIGAGAGFPGLAVAFGLMDRGVAGADVALVESIRKKADFLSDVVAETGAPARVLPVRAESLDPDMRVDVVTARAVASLTKLIGYARPFVENGAIALFPKGARHRDELTEARKSWSLDLEVLASETAPDAAILKIERIARVR
ncbi:16S rRNA (guanine(527)-N(7))-methyltransferase RsmG [Marinicauda salina]|uniref:Ribosomal RNA small subunit methyltransferase G n=1 Tax=Marinicauda salina TaxID=2135793 RepID=A0A2U2BWI7_9PROT|nr:16S rRNA (guanine(527)-N(7))-methyltransferase RsmG [Marinicauda salina]PWE18350.1 16S rRNA (guanine(527)-N(7))-methyltransferase RsmG [Marinicauda salina]